MRPCPACGTAIANNTKVCPACGTSTPLRSYDGPPPESGPGVSGGPEERAMVRGWYVFGGVAAMVCGGLAVTQWGAWGLLAVPVAFLLAIALRILLEMI